MLPNNHNNSRKINYKSTCTSSLLKYPYIHFFLRKSKNIKKCQGLITRGQGQSWGNTALSQGRGMYWAPSNPSK